MPHEPGSVVIVGGGVIGCFIAFRLAQENVSVTLVEKDSVGSGASGTSAGNVIPNRLLYGDLELDLGVESLNLFRRHLPEIKERSGIDILDQDVRYLFAALDDDEVRTTTGDLQAMQAAGLRAEWMSGAEARRLEPRLSPEVRGGLLHQDCIQIDGQRFVSALVASAEDLGATVVHAEAVGLRHEGARVTGVLLQGVPDISCDTVILAMGGHAGVVAPDWLGINLPIRPHALQKLHLRIIGRVQPFAVNWGGVNVITRKDGLTHAGSRHDDTGFEARTTEEGREWLLERVRAILPGLQAEVVEAGAAAAAETADNVPMIGPIPGFDGVYLASPATDGFHVSSGVAEIFAELLVHGREHRLLPQLLPERLLLPGGAAG